MHAAVCAACSLFIVLFNLHKQHQEQAAKVELGACLVPLATGAAHFVAVDGQFQFSAAHLMHCMQLSQPANTSGYLDNCVQSRCAEAVDKITTNTSTTTTTTTTTSSSSSSSLVLAPLVCWRQSPSPPDTDQVIPI
ncbi:hypothetical protein T4B_5574 [Trichinella pseudospiralis]|uniref:Uncharacterized protein n=1 Tax=Trichinella pseudospiralis TaxID=6337 RepID=A0A0V1ICL1_TRIPS|nr:hypothetical protein T4B_5574 [Trichinella pseudospiralis]